MQANYISFIARVINKYEGGYCWDKGDPGGPTNFGITCYDLAEERKQKMTSMAAWAPLVKAMPESEAEAIYATKYKEDFDDLPAGPDCAELDYKINSGIGRVRLVRPKILALAGKRSVAECDPVWYVDALCQERLQFMHQIRGGSAWAEFGKGWGARVADLKAYCENLAHGARPEATGPHAPLPSSPKATHDDPDLSQHSGASGGAVVAAGGAAVSQGAPWELVVPVMVIGVGCAVGYYLWQNNRAAALNQTVILPATIPPHP